MSYFSSPVKERSLYCGDFPLEFDFSAKTLDIPVNHGDCQFSAAASISDRAIACVKLPVYFDVIPVLGVTHISDAKVVLAGPEEWNGIETFPPPQHVARGSLPLTLGDNPVFDADTLAGEPVRPSRDVTSGEDARNA